MWDLHLVYPAAGAESVSVSVSVSASVSACVNQRDRIFTIPTVFLCPSIHELQSVIVRLWALGPRSSALSSHPSSLRQAASLSSQPSALSQSLIHI